jgi:hypothetical protein
VFAIKDLRYENVESAGDLMIAEGYKRQIAEINNSDNSDFSYSKSPCTIVSFRLYEEHIYT